jgi:nucleoid-associated protein YgaU
MRKMLLLIFLLTGVLMLVSCAQPESDGGEQTAFSAGLEDGDPSEADFIVDGEEPELSSLSGDAEMISGGMRPSIEGGEIAEYVVEKNDTLMLIAFNIYGDYGKWKDLLALNPGLAPNSLQAGKVIKYVQPAAKFVWNPQGNPYLIKNGDTLGTISNDVYATMKRWRDIYENNRPMIKDPNLIFAGFTLYYIPDSKIAMDSY